MHFTAFYILVLGQLMSVSTHSAQKLVWSEVYKRYLKLVPQISQWSGVNIKATL